MSRPILDDNRKRSVQVNIRLTAEESNQVNDYAEASGLSPANWIRHKVFTGKNPPVKLSPLDASIYQELKRIGVNFNQVAHKLNRGDSPTDLEKALIELRRLLDSILKTLLNDREHDPR